MKPADQAVEELIQKYSKLVFHTIYSMTGDWEESQDLTQDTFHQALKAIDAAREASKDQFREKPWLMSIALNNVRMQRRRLGLFRFIPFSSMQKGKQTSYTSTSEAETLTERAAPVQPGGYGAREEQDPAELIAERDAIQRTLAKLPETLRECLVLSIIDNFSMSEIASMLAMQEAAVRQRLTRARKQFQQLYGLEISDNGTPAHDRTGGVQKHNNVRQKHEERVESHISADDLLDATTPFSLFRSHNGKRLNRNPAATSLR